MSAGRLLKFAEILNPKLAEAGLSMGTPDQSGVAPQARVEPATQNVDFKSNPAMYVQQGLMKRGMPQHIADGFVMNFKDESAFNPGVYGDGGSSFGLAQWHKERGQALKNFARQQGVSPYDPDTQMDYLMTELNGREQGAWSKIQNAKTAGEAGAAIVRHFERPAENHLIARERKYLGYADGYQLPSGPARMSNGQPRVAAGRQQTPSGNTLQYDLPDAPDPMQPGQAPLDEAAYDLGSPADDAFNPEDYALGTEMLEPATEAPADPVMRFNSAMFDYLQSPEGREKSPAEKYFEVTFGRTVQNLASNQQVQQDTGMAPEEITRLAMETIAELREENKVAPMSVEQRTAASQAQVDALRRRPYSPSPMNDPAAPGGRGSATSRDIPSDGASPSVPDDRPSSPPPMDGVDEEAIAEAIEASPARSGDSVLPNSIAPSVPYSTGSGSAPAPQPAAPSSGGGGASVRSAPAAPAATDDDVAEAVATADQPAAPPAERFVDRMLDKLYKTSDLTDEDKLDRRRAMTLALAEGFRELAGGQAADYRGIANDRINRQMQRRAAEEVKMNARGLSDMLVAAGRPDLAQLPLMGPEGRAAAIDILQKSAGQGQGADPAYRAALAATLMEAGQPALAQGIMTLQGKQWDDLHSSVLGMQTREKKTEKDTGYTSEAREALATQLESNGQPDRAKIVRAGASDSVIDAFVKDVETPDQSGDDDEVPEQARNAVADYFDGKISLADLARVPNVPKKILEDAASQRTAVDPALQKSAGEKAIDAAADKERVTGMADAFTQGGRPDIAAVVSQAATAEDAMKAVENMQTQEAKAVEEAGIKTRAAALAAAIPADQPELRNAALTARTSQDLQIVYQRLADLNGRTPTQKDYEYAKADPDFAKYVFAKEYAASGAAPIGEMGKRIVSGMVTTAAENYSKSRAQRAKVDAGMRSVRAFITNPNTKFGPTEAALATYVQPVLNDVFGDRAPNVVNDPTQLANAMLDLNMQSNFATAAADLVGAFSNMESQTFKDTFPRLSGTRIKALALSQYSIKMSALLDAEMSAQIEWMGTAEARGKSGDLLDLQNFVREKTEPLRVFKEFSDPKELAKYQASNKAIDPYELVLVYDKNGVGHMMPVGGTEYIARLK